jgi:solute carrier family 25 aspartate/glutamate transporter 12/13
MSTQPVKEKPKKLPLPVKLVVGACAGVVGTSCIFPIDMIKTRLQATGKGSGVQYSGPIDCFRKIVANEGGFRALYKGLVPNLIGVTPEKAIKLAVNEFIREKFEKDDGSIALHHEVMAGAGAGLCQVIATNPMEILKIRMQVQALLPEAERRTAIEVVKGLGLKGMYRGTVSTLLRDVPFSVLFFPTYSNISKLLADPDTGKSSIGSTLVSGAVSGAIASGCVTPMDVLKTRLQLQGGLEKYKNVQTCFKMVVAEEGTSALFKGATARMFVVAPLFAITLLAFETQKNYMISTGQL